MMAQNTVGMKKIARQIQNVIDDIRVLSHMLNPSNLGNEGLYAAVKELIDQTNSIGNLYIKLKIGDARYLKQIPANITLNLFRIIQEALNITSSMQKQRKLKLNYPEAKTRWTWKLKMMARGLYEEVCPED